MLIDRFVTVAAHFMARGWPLLAVGQPGVGKSQGFEQGAAAAGFKMVNFYPVVDEPSTYEGLPALYKEEEIAKFLPYEKLAILVSATEPTVANFEDLGQQPSVLIQGAIMQLIRQREVGRKPISPLVTFVASTNRTSDKAGVGGIIEPLLNRFYSIVQVETSIDAWASFILDKGYTNGPLVVAFVHSSPDAVLEWKPAQGIAASCTPRSLEAAIQILDSPPSEILLHEVLAGCIGSEFATKLLGFRRIVNELPDFNEIATSPMTARIPDRTTKAGLETMYAMLGAIASRITPTNVDNMLKYVERLPGEFRVLGIKMAQKAKPKITSGSKVFVQHVLQNASLYTGMGIKT